MRRWAGYLQWLRLTLFLVGISSSRSLRVKMVIRSVGILCVVRYGYVPVDGHV